MREIKVSHLLNCTLEDFLAKVGAAPDKIGYPSEVFISNEDAAVLKRNNRRKMRKEHRYASKASIDKGIGLYWLQYGPSNLLGKAVRPGYALVDAKMIEKLHKQHTTPYKYEVTAVSEPTRWEKIKKFFDKHFVFRG